VKALAILATLAIQGNGDPGWAATTFKLCRYSEAL
jgi:hypothetical protein